MLFRLISLHSFIYNTPRYARKRSHQRSYFIHSFTKAVTVHGPGTRSQEGGQLSRHTSHTFTKAAAALPSSRGVKRAHPTHRHGSETPTPTGRGQGPKPCNQLFIHNTRKQGHHTSFIHNMLTRNVGHLLSVTPRTVDTLEKTAKLSSHLIAHSQHTNTQNEHVTLIFHLGKSSPIEARLKSDMHLKT